MVDFEELGMEAVRKIRVENFPAFIIVEDKGNDFSAEWAHCKQETIQRFVVVNLLLRVILPIGGASFLIDNRDQEMKLRQSFFFQKTAQV